MAERRRLLAEQHDNVFGVLPQAEAACGEVLQRLVAYLTTQHPDWFECTPNVVPDLDRIDADLGRKALAVPPVSWPGVVRSPTSYGGAQHKVVGGRAKPGHDTGDMSPPIGRDPGLAIDTILTNHLTGESWDLADLPCHPLELAGRLVQEDLCIIQPGDDGPLFTAGVLCFPSRWRLHEKLGRPLAQVHGPVPHYAERLANPVDRFMAKVKPGHIASRLNWSVVDDAALYQPTGKWREATNAAITAENAGETLYLRVERQTLTRMPESGAVLFGIRVHSNPLAAVITKPAAAARLAEAVRALPEATVHYKSLKAFGPALLAWLDARSH
jgi:hypothetical protein